MELICTNSKLDSGAKVTSPGFYLSPTHVNGKQSAIICDVKSQTLSAHTAISHLVNNSMHKFGRTYKVSLERYIPGIKIGWNYTFGLGETVRWADLTVHGKLSPIRMGAYCGHHEFLVRNAHV